MGSGFIVRPDGVVLTNAHVVDGATEVTVKLADRREFTAKVVGVDKLTDTAVLKIDAQNLPSVHIGNPADTRVGEWVLAIGSPFGFENTVTAGIVSAKSRSLPEEGYVPFIQTDVAVNPGNSGGPLLNIRGEVIGINSQIYSRTGGYQGLSFAIPIDVALNVEQQLLEKGRVSRGKLGIAVQDLTQGLAESFGLPNPNGALVGMVPPDGPGAKAGIKPGDVILELNGKTVRDSRELPPKVADMKPGSEAVLKVWREGKAVELKATVAELEDKSSETAEKAVEQVDHGRLGLAVRPLTTEEQKSAQILGGLRVEKVTGPSAKAGIRKGDIVLAVNGQPIKDATHLRNIAEQAGKHLALLIQRGDSTLFVPVQLD
jgi:serine protease Do